MRFETFPGLSLAAPVAIAWAAWIACGVYFLATALFTNRIRVREKAPHRLLDALLLWSGYAFLFIGVSRAGALQATLAHHPWWQYAGAAAAAAGLAFTVWSRFVLGRYWSGVVALKQDHRLVQNGPYRRIRHPLYTGLILAATGTAVAAAQPWTLPGVVLLTLCFLRRARREDALLSQHFGAEFDTYRRQTGQLLPRLG